MEVPAPRRTIAIIPARGGSRRLPSKNLFPLRGRPLLAHSISQALSSDSVEQVYVSTEDTEIAAVADAYGAEVVPRPLELAGDRATSESALLHALDWRNERGLPDPDLVVFLQATSPVRRPTDIDAAIERLERAGADSLLSACEDAGLLWADSAGGPRSLNYDFRARQREQDMPRQIRENGSIYVFRPQVLREHGNRLGGRIAVYEMDYWSSFQIDTHKHLELIEWILGRPEYATAVTWPAPLGLLVFDFDGLMT
jgi:CMP-N,N'-diacetyllegionaminic acid synthase